VALYRREQRRAAPNRYVSRPKLHAVATEISRLRIRPDYNIAFTVDETSSAGESMTRAQAGRRIEARAISDQQSAFDALRESESRFRTLAECAPVVVWVTDVNGSCTYLSKYWREFTGRDPEQDLGDKWVGALHPDDRERVARDFNEAARTARPFSGEYRVLRANGEYGWFSDVGVPFPSANGSYAGHIGTCIDITEHKRRETTGHKVQDNLILGQEAERKRVARELHDGIGQRIALLGMSLKEIERLASSAPGRLDARLRSAEDELNEIAKEVHRLSHNLHPSTVTYLGLLPALRRLCREVSEQTTVAVEFAGPSELADMSEDAALALFRVAQECLANIAKHSHSREARVSLALDSGEVRLTVSDNGVGFDATRLQSAGGLGLISIQERARMLGAELTIRSTVSRGTTVDLRLPRQAGSTQGQA